MLPRRPAFSVLIFVIVPLAATSRVVGGSGTDTHVPDPRVFDPTIYPQ